MSRVKWWDRESNVEMSGMECVKRERSEAERKDDAEWEMDGIDYDERVGNEKKRRSEMFKQKFAQNDGTGSYKLKADGCFMRHQRTRKEQYMTEQESKVRNLETRSSAEFDEMKIQDYLGQLMRKGVPLVEDTVEQYIINNIDKLDNSKDNW